MVGRTSAPSLTAISLGDGLYFQDNDCDDGQPVSPKDDITLLLSFPHSLTQGPSSLNITPRGIFQLMPSIVFSGSVPDIGVLKDLLLTHLSILQSFLDSGWSRVYP